MMRPLLTSLATVALAGCVGEAEFQLQPTDSPDSPDAPGLPADHPTQVGTFQGLSEGLPGATLAGTAQFDGSLYAVAGDGLYQLPSGSNKWVSVALGAKASSVVRVDTSLWVTVTDGAAGSLYRMSFGEDALRAVTTAPSGAAYALLKKGTELLLATGTGLMASSDRGASWKSRSSAPIFQGAVTLVASTAATRMFALVGSKLWFSDDAGATWATGLVGDDVTAINAEAEYALVQTASHGTLRSDNYGNTFHALDLGATAKTFAASGQRAFAGTMTGMRVSDDGGLTWRDANAGLPAGTGVVQLFLAGASLVASTGQAVYVAQLQLN